MQAKTEELLYLLLWGAEQLSRPTIHNLTESFEGWAYRSGFSRTLASLERRQLLERQPSPTAERIYRLTEAGRVAALGGRDPEARWNRPWDDQWRMVVFDLPENQNAARVRLRRLLRDENFGCLQRSVWITPDPLAGLVDELSGYGEDVASFLAWEARPLAGATDAAIVAAAWDLDLINRGYEACLRVLEQLPERPATDPQSVARWQQWARAERTTWQAAVSVDPLLPARLLPRAYRGREAWQLRGQVLREAASRRKPTGS